MKHLLALLVVVFGLSACNSPAPLEYYKRCVVNTVYIQHYGVSEILELLNHPGLRYNEKKKDFDTVAYVEIIGDKVAYEQELLKQVDRLKVTTDARNMITASRDVLQSVIEGQQKYYMQLARMKDEKADPVSIQSTAFRLLETSEKNVQQKLNLLWGYGKIYADANEIDLSVVAPSGK